MNNEQIIQQLLANCKVSMKLVDGAAIKGRAKVNFGAFEINGFTVRNKEGKLWINPPSFKSPNGTWGKIFFSTYQKEFWEPLTAVIIGEFQKKNGAEFIDDIEPAGSSPQNKGEINVEDIPF